MFLQTSLSVFCSFGFFFFFLKGNSGHWASWSQEVGKGVGQVAFEKEGVAL